MSNPLTAPIDPEALLGDAFERLAARHGGTIRATPEALGDRLAEALEAGGSCDARLREMLVRLAEILLLGAALDGGFELAGRPMRVAFMRWRETAEAEPIDIVEVSFGDGDDTDEEATS